MSGLSSPTLPPNFLNSRYDGFYWGIFISTMLLGITIVQGWIYINTNNDKWPVRSLVATLILMDTAHTFLNGQILHNFFVANYGNPAVLVFIPGTIKAEFGLTVFIVFFVQLYFASRVYLFSNNPRWIPAIIGFFAFASFASGMATIFDMATLKDIRTLANYSLKIATGLDHGFASLADIATTIALSRNLAMSRSPLKRTQTVLQKLLLYTVTRGLLVTVVQVIFLIMFEWQPASLNWTPLHFCLSKVYVITMVAMLNSRVSLSFEMSEPVEINTLDFAFPTTRDTSDALTSSRSLDIEGSHPIDLESKSKGGDETGTSV